MNTENEKNETIKLTHSFFSYHQKGCMVTDSDWLSWK